MNPITNEQLLKIAKALGWEADKDYFLEGSEILVFRMDGKPCERFWDPSRSIEDALQLPKLLGMNLEVSCYADGHVSVIVGKGEWRGDGPLQDHIVRAVLRALEKL